MALFNIKPMIMISPNVPEFPVFTKVIQRDILCIYA